MLQSLRENTGKWFVKLLLGAIIASFALWGIGDVIKNYSRSKPVVVVGTHKISPEEYAHSVRKEMRRLQMATKGQMTAAQMRAAGIYNFVLQKMIQDSTLSQEVNRLRLDIPDEILRSYIHKMKVFEKNGVFSKEIFDRVLSFQDMSEQEFILDARKSLINTQLMSALTAGPGLPKFYTTMLFKELDVQKTFSIVEVDYSKITLKGELSEDSLKTFYETNRDHYKEPESRSLDVVWVSASKLASSIKIDPSDLVAYYQDNKSELFPDGKTQPFEKVKGRVNKAVTELRYPELISKIKDEVDDNLAAGQSLSELAKERKWTFITTDNKSLSTQGWQNSLKSLDKNVAKVITEQAFNLESMQDSSFIEIPGKGAFIVLVKNVTPPAVPAFNNIKDKVKKDWTKDQKHRKAIDLAHKISIKAKSLDALKSEASRNSLKVKTGQTYRRSDFINNNKQPEELTDIMLSKAFAQKAGESVYGTSPKGAVVVFLEKELPYKQSKKDYVKFKKVMEVAFERDLSSSFVESLKNAQRVEVNQQVFKQIIQN